MQQFVDALIALWNDSGIARLMNFDGGGWKNLIMIAVACVLLYLAIKKQFEPLLLLPIAFGMLLVNLPLGGVMDPQRNSVVPFSQEEFVQYMEGSYEQVYPVMENELGTVPVAQIAQRDHPHQPAPFHHWEPSHLLSGHAGSCLTEAGRGCHR